MCTSQLSQTHRQAVSEVVCVGSQKLHSSFAREAHTSASAETHASMGSMRTHNSMARGGRVGVPHPELLGMGSPHFSKARSTQQHGMRKGGGWLVCGPAQSTRLNASMLPSRWRGGGRRHHERGGERMHGTTGLQVRVVLSGRQKGALASPASTQAASFQISVSSFVRFEPSECSNRPFKECGPV
eukprot:364753-Chlamydomonas_euryale.AAC.3